MDKERILELADHIEGLTYDPRDVEVNDEAHFNMAHYRYLCGSPACIAGHAAALAGEEDDDTFDVGMEYLGLTIEQARVLFSPINTDINKPLAEVTPEDAARTLRHLANTGVVNWDKDDEADDKHRLVRH